MKPVFCAEVFNRATVATFSVAWSGAGTPFNITWTVPAGLYWLGALSYPGAPSIGDAFADQLDSADPSFSNWSFSVNALSDAIGAACRLNITTPSSTPTITATNDAAAHVLWCLGFRNVSSVTLSSGVGFIKYAQTTGIPYATWWPKSYATRDTEFSPFSALAFTSELVGSGIAPATVRMDDPGELRQWRTFAIVAIHGARMEYMRAARSSWLVGSGLTTNATDSALDAPGWWWAQTVNGASTFAYIEDELELVGIGSPKFSTYRIWRSADNPVGMDGWRGLRSPNVTDYSPAAGRKSLNFCAALVSMGNL